MRNLKMTTEQDEQGGLKFKNSLKEFKYFRKKKTGQKWKSL